MLWMGGRPFLFSSFLDGQCFWFSPICLVKAILQMLCLDLLKKKTSGWKGRMCEELRGCSCMLLVWSGKFYFHQGVLNRVSVATMSYSMPVFLQCKKSTPVLFQTIFCCQNSK